MKTTQKQAIASANRMRKMRVEGNTVKILPCADPKRRKRLEASPAEWLMYYLAESFPDPFCEVHIAIINAAKRTMTDGVSMCVAAPRGMGKSTILDGMAFYGVLSGLIKYPVVVGWKHDAVKQSLDGWIDALSENKRITDDYPLVCAPFIESTQSKRVENLTWTTDSKTPKEFRYLDGEACGAGVKKTTNLLKLPLGAMMSAKSIQASIRGLRINHKGKWVRPDCILLDDPQDIPTASSRTMVDKIVNRIQQDLLSLAGHRKRMAMMAAVTVICVDDVAEKLLKRRDVEALRYGQITEWPEDFDKLDSVTRKSWEQWNETRLDGIQDGDAGESAKKYYLENKEVMTRGMEVSWPERFDAERGDPDALYAAMLDYYRLGHDAFMSERQNEPVNNMETGRPYTITPEIIKSKVNQYDRSIAPNWVGTLIASTDLNPSYALSTAIVGFGKDQSAAVVWYGLHEMNVEGRENPTTEAKARVFEELKNHGKHLASLQCKPDAWFIDCSGTYFDTVNSFCNNSANLCGLKATPLKGVANSKYKPWGKQVVGSPREQCHMRLDVKEVFNDGRRATERRKWVVWDSDYWKEIAQRSWLGSVGAPGACSIYPGNHSEFAEQICRETLSIKGELSGTMFWRWVTQPGKHDFGDCMAMCYAGAAWGGIGTGGGGAIKVARKYVEVRKAKVQRQQW